MRTEIIDAIHNEYKDHYQDAQLIGSYSLFAPFYRVKLKMDYIVETDLTVIEQFVCRCIQQGITEMEEIKYVLALTNEMLSFTVKGLEFNQYLTLKNGQLSFTPQGEKLFSQEVKHDANQKVIYCYYDGLTPEYKIEFVGNENEHTFLKYKQIDEEVRQNVLMPQTFPTYEENRDFHKLSQQVLQYMNEEKEELEGKQPHKVVTITNFELESDREVFYHEYLIMVFKNKEGLYHLLAYDPCGTEFVDQRLTHVLQELLEKDLISINLYESQSSDLKEIVHALKNYARSSSISLGDEEREETYERLDKLEKAPITSKYIMNYEIRKLFLAYLKEAKESLYIISPWMNNYIVNDEFINDIKNLLERGVKVAIIYGITAEDEQGDIRDKNTNTLAQKLKKIGKKYNGQLTITHGQTHEKLLICDRKYYINGSFNFLSYSGEEDGKFFRNEGSTYSEDPILIEETIKLRFREVLVS